MLPNWLVNHDFNLKTLSGFLPLWHLLMLPFILLLFCYYLSFYQCIYYGILLENTLKKKCYTGPYPLVPELKLWVDGLPHELSHPWQMIGEEFFCGNFSMILHSKITKLLLFLNTLSACLLFPDATDSSKLPASHVWHRTLGIFFVISVSFSKSSDLSDCIFPYKMPGFMSLSTFLLCQAPATWKMPSCF